MDDIWSDMPKEYIPRYASPNIIIIPTTTFVKTTENKDKSENNVATCASVRSVQTTDQPLVHTKQYVCEPTNLVQIIPAMKTNNLNAPLNPEGNSINPSEIKPTTPQAMERNQTGQPKIVQTFKHSASLENAKSIKPNSWASNYLQSVGQNHISPLKKSPPGIKITPKSDMISTLKDIKINLLTKKKEVNTDSTSIGLTTRLDTKKWSTQIASSPNVKLDCKTNEPLPKIHMSQVQPKSDSVTDFTNTGVPSCNKLGDTSINSPLPPTLDQAFSPLNQNSNNTTVKYNEQADTIKYKEESTCSNNTIEPQSSKNHYECLDQIFTDIQTPQNKNIDLIGFENADLAPDTQYTKISSRQEYKEDRAEGGSDCKRDKKNQSSSVRNTESNNYSIYYKDKFGTKFYKTKGLIKSQNNRKRGNSEVEDYKRPDNKRRKLVLDTDETNKKPIRRSSDNEFLTNNDPKHPEQTKNKRKRVTNSENEYNNHMETKQSEHSREMPQKKQNHQGSPPASICPVISVVKTAEKLPKHPRIQHPDYTSSDEEQEQICPRFDLRSKLNNKYALYSKTNRSDQRYEKPLDNLRITINRSDDEDLSNSTTNQNDDENTKNKTSFDQNIAENIKNNPIEIESITKPKRKKYKKIKLIINVVCKDKEDGSDSSSSSDDSNSDQKINTTRSDLSFLDDFNIDEIVNSLARSPNQNSYPKINDQLRKTKNTEVVKNLNKIWCSKKFVQPMNIKKEVKLESIEKEEIVLADKTSCEVPAASENHSASVNNKVHEKFDLSPTNENEVLKDKQSTNEQVDTIKDVKQEKSVNECPNINDKTSEHNIVINSLESSTVLANIKDLKQETPNAYSHNPKTDFVQLKAVLVNTEACIAEPTLKMTHQSYENEIGKTKQNINAIPSAINKDDVEIINDNVLVIDLTINEPEVTEEEIKIVKLPVNENTNTEDNNSIKTGKERDTQVTPNEINVCNESKINKIRLPEKEYINKEEKNEIYTGKECHKINLPEEICTNEENNSEIKSNQDVSKVTEAHEIIELTESTSGKENRKDTLAPQKLCTNKINNHERHAGQDTGVEKKSFQDINEINLPQQIETQKKELSDTKETTGTDLLEDVCIDKENNNVVKTSTEDNNVNKINVVVKSDKEEKPHEPILTKEASDKKSNNNINTQESQKCASKVTENPTNIEKTPPNIKKAETLEIQIEKRILDYMHQEMTVTSLISQGKFSKVFKCKDSGGIYYALKITNHSASRVSLGIEKEDMITNFQKDVPKENLNTVLLLNAFGLDRSWCFLMEYYPMNLSQALLEMGPFHINDVQHLSRQLVSAVMLLRNNNIVHSDIKPTHILLDTTKRRLKLCGFDRSYYGHSMIDLVPNIGSHVYRAPEVIVGYSASFSIDVWSTATVIYEMATNKSLFTGKFNNGVLFQQCCLSGNMPMDVIENSLYASNHYRGPYFMRRCGYYGQDIKYMCNFYKTNRVHKEMMITYNQVWGNSSDRNKSEDLTKIMELNKLLKKMLIIDPRERINIEFVCADPFINEMYTLPRF